MTNKKFYVVIGDDAANIQSPYEQIFILFMFDFEESLASEIIDQITQLLSDINTIFSNFCKDVTEFTLKNYKDSGNEEEQIEAFLKELKKLTQENNKALLEIHIKHKEELEELIKAFNYLNNQLK